jgi:hypothetical protein
MPGSEFPGSTAGIDPEVVQARQARGERRLQPHEEVPGPELAAMGMARELKVEAQSDGRHRTARLVREQQPQGRADRRAMNRGLGIAAMATSADARYFDTIALRSRCARCRASASVATFVKPASRPCGP